MITVTSTRDTSPVYTITDVRPTRNRKGARTMVKRIAKVVAFSAAGFVVLSILAALLHGYSPAAKAAQSHSTAVESSSCAGVDLDNLSADQEQSLLDDGWTGDKADHAERLYPRGCVPGAPITTPLGSISCAGIDLNGLHADQVNSLTDAGWKVDYSIDHTGQTMMPGKCAPYPFD